MLCPACKTNAPDGSTVCPGCKAALAPPRRKRRRRTEGTENLDPARVAHYDQKVRHIQMLLFVSVVPFIGLVLGPVCAWLSWRLLRRGKEDPAFTARKGARLELRFALFCTAAQWVGLVLLLVGLRGA